MNTEQKTAREWFSFIRNENVKSKALANLQDEETKFESLASAILYSFIWEETEEGDDYWGDRYDEAINNEL